MVAELHFYLKGTYNQTEKKKGHLTQGQIFFCANADLESWQGLLQTKKRLEYHDVKFKN